MEVLLATAVMAHFSARMAHKTSGLLNLKKLRYLCSH